MNPLGRCCEAHHIEQLLLSVFVKPMLPAVLPHTKPRRITSIDAARSTTLIYSWNLFERLLLLLLAHLTCSIPMIWSARCLCQVQLLDKFLPSQTSNDAERSTTLSRSWNRFKRLLQLLIAHFGCSIPVLDVTF